MRRRGAVAEFFGDVTFRLDHEAAQFRESEDIRRKGLASLIPVEESEPESEE